MHAVNVRIVLVYDHVVAHVNIHEMIRHLKNDERDFYYQRALRSAGNPPKPIRKRYRELNQRLIRITTEFEANRIGLSDYVMQVGYLLNDPQPNEVRTIMRLYFRKIQQPVPILGSLVRSLFCNFQETGEQ